MTTKHLIGYNIYNPYLTCSCDTSFRYNEAELTQHLLDAGRADAKGELVKADDPRIKPGARVRLEFVPRPEFTREALEGVVERSRRWHLEVYGWPVKSLSISAIYLLSEAPDPDAEVREALGIATQGHFGNVTTAGVAEVLDALRAAGYDVVKVLP